MVLTSLLELIRARISSNWPSFRNWTGYRMQDTRYRVPRASALASKLAVTDVEVAETAAGFLASKA